MTSSVDRLHSDLSNLEALLDDNNELSLRITAEETFRKSMLLAAASYFESRITDAVIEYCTLATGEDDCVVAFVRNQGLKRKYHTLFNWDGANANKFFALFGEEFHSQAKARIAGDVALNEGVRAFLTIGQDRNRLVHQDFGTFSLEKTAEEIMDLYRKALVFVDALPTLLRTCLPGGMVSTEDDNLV